jgi:hypothetical protein
MIVVFIATPQGRKFKTNTLLVEGFARFNVAKF